MYIRVNKRIEIHFLVPRIKINNKSIHPLTISEFIFVLTYNNKNDFIFKSIKDC